MKDIANTIFDISVRGNVLILMHEGRIEDVSTDKKLEEFVESVDNIRIVCQNLHTNNSMHASYQWESDRSPEGCVDIEKSALKEYCHTSNKNEKTIVCDSITIRKVKASGTITIRRDSPTVARHMRAQKIKNITQ